MRYLIFCLAIFPYATFGTILTSTEFITGIPGVSDIGSFEVSPDGKHLYAISNAENVLAAFAIDNTSGSLTSIDTETTGIPANSRTVTTHLRLSLDGKFVYVAGGGTNAITLYTRDGQSGELTLVTENAAEIPADQVVNSIIISPDSQNLYAITLPSLPIAGFESTIYTYAINAQSGVLNLQQNFTMLEAHNNAGFTSPDGKYLYIAELNDSFRISLNLFNRDDQGDLTLVGDSQAILFSLTSEVPAINSNSNTFYFLHSLEADPPGGFLSMLERDAGNGQFVDESSVPASRRFFGDDAIKLIDNDRLLIGDNPLMLYRIPALGGNPLQLEDQIINTTAASMDGTQPALAISIDQRFLYVAGPNGIIVFRIEPLALGDIPEVPVLNSYGLVALILSLLLVTGWIYIYRRHLYSTD